MVNLRLSLIAGTLFVCQPGQAQTPTLNQIFQVTWAAETTVNLLGGGSTTGKIFTVAERPDRSLPLLTGGTGVAVFKRYSATQFGFFASIRPDVASFAVLLTPGEYLIGHPGYSGPPYAPGGSISGLWIDRTRQSVHWQPTLTLESFPEPNSAPGTRGVRGKFTISARPDGSLPVLAYIDRRIVKLQGSTWVTVATNQIGSPGVILEPGQYAVDLGLYESSAQATNTVVWNKFLVPCNGYWAKP